jgi:hypothetical protein
MAKEKRPLPKTRNSQAEGSRLELPRRTDSRHCIFE